MSSLSLRQRLGRGTAGGCRPGALRGSGQVPSRLLGSVAARTAAPARTSLIPDTLDALEEDEELKQHLQAVEARGQAALTREERKARQRSLDALNVPPFAKMCKESGMAPLVRSPATILQVNIGLYCNQACSHCHVESSPLRKAEMMDRPGVERCLALLRASPGVKTLDITGGAPELHPEFRYLVAEASRLGVEVIDRCNLTVLLEPGQEDTVAFLAAHKVRVVASLPCYSESNVDKQRGRGVFERSIEALKLLNAAGYGVEGSGLTLDLVYNPGGAFLAPDQAKLQAAYKSELGQAYGIVFSRLLALNNMPIKRYADWLLRQGKLQDYMATLVQGFNPGAGAGLMCRDTVSVRWDGALHDCDFNQQLALPMAWPAPSSGRAGASPSQASAGSVSDDGRGSGGPTIYDVNSLDELTGRPILVDNHCYGCTAGSGSSCQGAI